MPTRSRRDRGGAGGHDFGPHVVLGDTIFAVALVLLAIALAAQVGRRGVVGALVLLVLLAVQASLPFAGPPGVRALHPLLGLLVLGAAVEVTRSAFRERSPQQQHQPHTAG